MGERGTLPPGWVWTTLSEAATVLDSKRVPINADEREQRIANKKPHEVYPYFGATGQVGWIDDYLFDEELVLLGEDGAPFLDPGKSKAYIIKGRTWVNNHAHVLRAISGLTLNSYLMHTLNVFDYHGYVTGTTRLKLNQSEMRKIPIPLPPLPEQHRIVAEIEELFTQLDAGVAALKRVQANLKRYRASVLKAACEGRLAPQDPAEEPADRLLARILAERRAKWEAEHPGKKYVEPAAAVTDGLPELPVGWCWAKVNQVGHVQLGRQRAPQYHDGPFMRPYLRVANVFEDRIDTSDVLQMNFDPHEYEKYLLQHGDILLNEGQSPELLGRPAMYRGEVPGACFQNTLVRFQAYDGLLPALALCVFRSYMHSGRFRKIAQITTNIAHLSTGRFAEVEFPLPPLPEQHRIVAEVERRLSVISELEGTVAANLARAGRLRQAVLKRAFEGRLVGQDAHGAV